MNENFNYYTLSRENKYLDPIAKTYISCIYMLISPENKVYIGQTVNLYRRISRYKNLDCKSQSGIYNSILKYGFDNHKVVILEYCGKHNLIDRERYYQDLYNVISDNGLNRELSATQDKNKVVSNETKIKLSISNKGKNLGRKHSAEYGKRISLIQTGRKLSIITKSKMSISHKGFKHSDESKRKMSTSKKGKVFIKDSHKLILSDLRSGEKSPFAKLNEEQVKEIRKSTNQTHKTLAKRYGVSTCAISNIINYKTWKKITA